MLYRLLPTLIGVILSVCNPSQAAALGSEYNKLQERLLSGAPTVSLLYTEKCDKLDGKPASAGSGVIGGAKIDEFIIKPDPNARISYANSHFTVRPDGTPVLEFIQYKINPDDTADIIFWRLSPTTHTQLSEPIRFKCKVGEGVKFKP